MSIAALHAPDREALLVPDRITADTNFDFILPDFDLAQPEEVKAPVGRKGRISHRDINLQEDFNSSQYLTEVARHQEELGLAPAMDLELDIDFGLEFDEAQVRGDLTTMDIETGREAPLPQPSIEEDLFGDLRFERSKESPAPRRELDDYLARVRVAEGQGDIEMGEDMTFDIADQSMLQLQRMRESLSPLSDVDPEFAKEVEREYALNQQRDEYEQQLREKEKEEAVSKRSAQRAKKQKGFVPDATTVLTMTQMKEVQDNPAEIQQPQRFLPRDAHVLSLLDLHTSRGLVASVLLDRRSREWAPELEGMLSMRPVRTAQDLKRKRRAEEMLGREGEEEAEGEEEEAEGRPRMAAKSPRLELEHEPGFDESIIQTMVLEDGTIVEIPADESRVSGVRHLSPEIGEEETGLSPFDETTAPIVHPADSGPVSMATKHAVHMLRELFGPDAEHDEQKRTDTTVIFQDLLPEARTSKADATKMFFECLVLATKDAIKVEQEVSLGAPIRIRAKRGLWGAWAEHEAGGEMAERQQEEGEEERLPQQHSEGQVAESVTASSSPSKIVAVGA